MSHDERVAVVDKDNKVIGYKLRTELTDDDCWRIAYLWVENSRGQVLMQQRSKMVGLNPELWTPAAAGTVDGDDSYEATALREAEEEIGLIGCKVLQQNSVYMRASFGSRWAQGFTAICDWSIEKFKLQTEEVMKLEWVDRQQILDELTDKIPHSRHYTSVYKTWPELFNLA